MAKLITYDGIKVTVPERTIVEPIMVPASIAERLKTFFPPTVYSNSPHSLLYKFFLALLGDAGVGRLNKDILMPRLNNNIHNVHFQDLDNFYGSIYGLNRLEEENYNYNPVSAILTQDEWIDVKRKDAWYRNRGFLFSKGIQYGNSPYGLSLIAESASGIECDIFERWQYLDDQISDFPIGIPNIGETSSRSEFVVQPRTENLTPKHSRRISRLMTKVKPGNKIFSIDTQDYNRIEIEPQLVRASSKYFQAKRLVTGSTTNNYPQVDPDNGLWIEPGQEKEAPLFAFGERSEFVTYPSILKAVGSSKHVGPFNQIQRMLFSHLKEIPYDLYQFDGNQAFLGLPLNLEFTRPWMLRNNTENTFVNDYFPVGYFADNDISDNFTSKLFWASEEKEPPAEDTLTVHFSSERTFNYLSFELSKKPISFVIEYYDGTNWQPVSFVYNDEIENNTATTFVRHIHWEHMQFAFRTIKTDRFRITFTRQETAFPYYYSPIFEWSIEVKNLKAGHIVAEVDDFSGTPDENDPSIEYSEYGVDILGNTYRTILEKDGYAAANVIDGALDTVWRSQAVPSKDAVEALYFDIRDDEGGAQTIDEIYIDPITSGCLMHIYWTNDDIDEVPENADINVLSSSLDDYRLWTPVPRHYTLTKGFHSLKYPITAKFIKLEFSRLVPMPYSEIGPNFKPIVYRTYPLWVQRDINALRRNDFDTPYSYLRDNEVELDMEVFGLLKSAYDRYDREERINLEEIQEDIGTDNQIQEDLQSYKTWIENSNVTYDQKFEINVYPRSIFFENLAETLDYNTSMNVNLISQNVSDVFIAEEVLPPKIIPDVASRNNRIDIALAKTEPEKYFFLSCRHGYRVLESPRNFNLAYYVAIREVSFHRIDNTIARDEPFYIDTLADDVSVQTNTFDQAEWRFIIPGSFVSNPTSTLYSEYGFESFNALTNE